MGTQIELTRSGGLGGLTMAASVDVDGLPPDEAAAVTDALARVDLGALAAQGSGSPSGPDRFQYDLTVSDDGGSRSVTLQESGIPPELRPVIDTLMARAQLR